MRKVSEASKKMVWETVRRYRVGFGYTQQKVADYLGIERSTYAKYEASRKPEIDILIRLAKLYGVSLDEFLGVSSITGVQAPQEENTVTLTANEQILVNCYRNSVRSAHILDFARKIYSEDCAAIAEIEKGK